MDIREILNSLEPEDKLIWSQYRTEMRRCYINAHNATTGVNQWDYTDDNFMDLIDIKLAILFDRAGKVFAVKDIIGADDAKPTEEALENATIEKKEAALSVELLPQVTQ